MKWTWKQCEMVVSIVLVKYGKNCHTEQAHLYEPRFFGQWRNVVSRCIACYYLGLADHFQDINWCNLLGIKDWRINWRWRFWGRHKHQEEIMTVWLEICRVKCLLYTSEIYLSYYSWQKNLYAYTLSRTKLPSSSLEIHSETWQFIENIKSCYQIIAYVQSLAS